MSHKTSTVPVLPPKTHLAQHDVYDATSRSTKFGRLPPTFTAPSLPSPAVHRQDVSIGLKSTNLFLLHNILTQEECYVLKAQAIACGFDEKSDVAAEYPPEYRNNKRLIVIEQKIADALWPRVVRTLKRSDVANVTPVGFATEGTWLPYHLNECFLFSRYEKGEFFKPHYDGMYKNPYGECSIYTVTFYLNDDYEGGGVKFLRSKDDPEELYRFKPVEGTALVFNHDTLHEGLPVTKGTKYIMRTSIMFRRVEDLSDLSRKWELNPAWQTMREVFHTFDRLSAAGDTVSFTTRFLECQKVQLEHGRSLHEVTPLPLPDELFHLILKNINVAGIVLSFPVSRSWKAMARTGSLWRSLYQSNFGEAAISLMESKPGFANTIADLSNWYGVFKQQFSMHQYFSPVVVYPANVCRGAHFANPLRVKYLNQKREYDSSIAHPSWYYYKQPVLPPEVLPPITAASTDERKCFINEPFVARLVENNDPWDPSFTNFNTSAEGHPWFSEWTTDITSFTMLLQLTDSVMSDFYSSRNSLSWMPLVYVVHPSLWTFDTTDLESEHEFDGQTWFVQPVKKKEFVDEVTRLLEAPAVAFIPAGVAALASRRQRSGIVISEHRSCVSIYDEHNPLAGRYSFLTLSAIVGLKVVCTVRAVLRWPHTGVDFPDLTPLITQLEKLVAAVPVEGEQAKSSVVLTSDVPKHPELIEQLSVIEHPKLASLIDQLMQSRSKDFGGLAIVGEEDLLQGALHITSTPEFDEFITITPFND